MRGGPARFNLRFSFPGQNLNTAPLPSAPPSARIEPQGRPTRSRAARRRLYEIERNDPPPAAGKGADPGAGGPGPGGKRPGGKQVGAGRMLPRSRPAGPAGPPAGHRSEHSALLPGGVDRCRDRRVYRGALHPGPEQGHRCGLSAGGGVAPPVAWVRPPDHLSGHDAERPVLHPGRGRAGALRAPSGASVPRSGRQRGAGYPGPGPPPAHRQTHEAGGVRRGGGAALRPVRPLAPPGRFAGGAAPPDRPRGGGRGAVGAAAAQCRDGGLRVIGKPSGAGPPGGAAGGRGPAGRPH
ncbi:Uncharacterised protein [Flavonifractor plautii]|nr:Uncharacterised protein [Flavonifractor plautii]CUQ51859.1 Uncharacterised protein [Flavonifractor plautii]